MGKLIVHHLGVSQSDRVVWLCEELGLDYELKKYDRAPIFSPPEYCKLHPLCAAPVIEDGDIKLAESAACVEYICHTKADGSLFVAPGKQNYADFLYWFHFANGTFQPMISRGLAIMGAGAGKESEAIKRFDAKKHQILSFLDQRLSQVPWLAGDDFTAADIMIVFSLTVMRCFYQYDLGDYENILAYLQRISKREAYKRALQKGDPDLDIEKLIGAAPPPLQKGLAARMK
ncbi:glutathione S-transferase [Rhizodiscina lignyota]|uniref:Glutathione S-transferase n=1 Tax=Rhizodiscina lignyota TaxID=1504668 RepID=A0A9P4MDL4_9PEZI|nr:glutathione S-transferase [Rhizodiscina lignyota]